ncbi:MAG: hypothetical protein PVS2B1_13160 [Candidatus Dormibacteraceae bacterium]
MRMINPGRAVSSPLAVLVLICAVVALLSQWLIRIPQAGLEATFGFQSPTCWLVVLAFIAALLSTNLKVSLAAAVAGEAVLLGWFGWAMWVATTSRFSGMDFPFMGIDIMGPGWFVAATGLLTTGAIVAARYLALEPRPGPELWLLASIPGAGLIRLHHTGRGAVYAVLIISTLILASTASPVGPLFYPIVGAFEPPPAPPTRSLEWILLGAAGAFGLLSIVDTIRMKRKEA